MMALTLADELASGPKLPAKIEGPNPNIAWARALRAKGWSHARIAAEIKISVGTAHNYTRPPRRKTA